MRLIVVVAEARARIGALRSLHVSASQRSAVEPEASGTSDQCVEAWARDARR